MHAASALNLRPLRTLSVDAGTHPRGQAWLSAASGLVCALGRVYVVADDEHHLAVFRDAVTPGTLHRLTAGDLPTPPAERKRLKPDLETLMWLPADTLPDDTLRAGSAGALVALGSGSTALRERAFVVPVGADGEPLVAATQSIALSPLFAPLRARWGEINIEGAFCVGDEFVLLQRGGDGLRGGNAVVRYAQGDVLPLWRGQRGGEIAPRALHPCALGALEGVGLGFTDGAAWPDAGEQSATGGAARGFLFTAVAEDSADHVADGACRGSVIGHLSLDGRLHWMRRLHSKRRLHGRPKVEGLALRVTAAGTRLCLVTDDDDPASASMLLQAGLGGWDAATPRARRT